MPLSKKGKKIMKSMKEQYGSKKGKSVFYASKNKGVIKGVEKKKSGGVTVKQLADAMRDTDRVTKSDIYRAERALKTRPKKEIERKFSKYTNRLSKKMTATEGSFKSGGSIKKPPKTPADRDAPIFPEKGLREKLKEKGSDMMKKYFPEPSNGETISLADGGMMKRGRRLAEPERKPGKPTTRPTFPGKPFGRPPVKGPNSQGMPKMKHGGAVRGCGKVMNDRRKLTKYY